MGTGQRLLEVPRDFFFQGWNTTDMTLDVIAYRWGGKSKVKTSNVVHLDYREQPPQRPETEGRTTMKTDVNIYDTDTNRPEA